ncbi:mitochondrial 54S ribosomal protein YmL15 [Starmerella bacillaris]|uniref:Mitochondrial 54S ribosomal protein YmL15 n=1 Tax=Starmerella bacillaris TaxID=1247836 RepID=A0AAV5RMR2_STABA|nr:mitochondrial 54S ribosomal protein YmL15 [Starmerella bacillaris]
MAYIQTRHVSSLAAVTAKGLRKLPEQYMRSVAGVMYPGEPTTLAPAKKFLGDFKLSDPLILQCLVHKSFAHGKVPYNEKLAFIGSELLRLEAARAAAQAGNQALPKELTINGQNFDISSNAIELLTSAQVLSKICQNAGLDDTLFYKTPKRDLTSSIRAKTVNAFVGAVLLESGSTAAFRFIDDRLMREHNLFSIAEPLYRDSA